MKLSNKQAIVLFQIAHGTKDISNPIGGFTKEYRLQLINDILNQQNETIEDLGVNEKRKI